MVVTVNMVLLLCCGGDCSEVCSGDVLGDVVVMIAVIVSGTGYDAAARDTLVVISTTIIS